MCIYVFRCLKVNIPKYIYYFFILNHINRKKAETKSSTIKWNCDQISNMNSVADAIRVVQFWLRLATLLLYPLKRALLFVLHNTGGRTDYEGLPEDETELYNKLFAEKAQINKLVKVNVIGQAEVDILLPPDKKTDSSTFDVTLIIVLIINFTTLKKPKNGWKILDPTDFSMPACILRARNWRNVLIHGTEPGSLIKADFDRIWSEGERIVKGLGLTTVDMNALKNINLDVRYSIVLNSVLLYIKKIQGRLDTHDREFIKVKADIDNVKADTDAVKTDVDNVKTDVDNVKTDVDNVKTDVGTVKTDVTNVKDGVTNVKGDVSKVKDDVTNIEDEVANVKNDVSKVKYTVTNVKDDVDDIKDDVDNVKDDVDNVKDTHGKQLTILQEYISIVKTNQANITINVDNVLNKVEDVEVNVTKVKDNVSNVRNDVTNVKVDVSEVKDDVTNIKDDVNNFKHGMLLKNKEIMEFMQQIKAIQKELGAKENQKDYQGYYIYC